MLLACAALADEAATLKSNLQTAIDQYTAAWKKKDAKTTERIIRAHFAKDFVSTMKTGQKMSLEEWIANDKMQMSFVKTVKTMSLKIDKVTVSGNKASSNETFLAEFMVDNPQTPGKTSTIKVKGTSKSTYKKVGGKWLISTMVEVSNSMTMDGKPFNPMGGGR